MYSTVQTGLAQVASLNSASYKEGSVMNQQQRLPSLTAPVSTSDHIQGPEDAKVTVVEYGDFECAACGQAYHAAKILLDRFGTRMRFVFRNFPLREVHPGAELAAEAAEAAGGQDRFWQMHDLLMENQCHLKAESLREYAAKVGLELGRFDREMRDHLYRQRVQKDIDTGTKSHIQCTPAFFVNGVLHDVSFGLEHLEQAIEDELAA
jgi:protein-disulfide isomerase